MLKRIFERICQVWVRRQEVAQKEEYELLTEVWQEEYQEPPIVVVEVPVVKAKPKMTWAEFKANNAMVNRYLDRVSVA